MGGQMRENFTGTVISVLVHAFIILPLALASFSQIGKTQPRTIEVDFSIIKDMPGDRQAQTIKTKTIAKSPKVEKLNGPSGKTAGPVKPDNVDADTVPSKDQTTPLPVPAVVTASDARGEMIVHGIPATYAGSSGSSRLLVSHGGTADDIGGGSGQGSGGGGKGLGGGSENYSYIRDAIMKNIKYPDRARRLGIEGKVMLSFTVLENGMIREVRVIDSSGYRILDESAKDAAAETRIARKMPHRIVVRLPIAYRLQH